MQNIPSPSQFSSRRPRLRSGIGLAMVLISSSFAAAANEAAPVVLPGERPAGANAVSASDWFLYGPIQAGDPRFGVASQMPEAREWQEQDLVQIIVIEKSRSKIDQKRELETDAGVSAEVAEFANFDFGAFNFSPGTSSLPGVEIGAEKEFDGKGKYQRQDEMTDRITARIVEVKPNGNLVLEARVVRNWSGDTTVIRLTGITRPDWITASGTIASNQLYDLAVDKTHSGAVERSTQRGFIAEVLDFLFAF
jgi:flagellar L-ring protein FlgH